jgi:hypothetical protein
MIAIDTVQCPMAGHESEAEANLYNFYESAHPDLFEFLKDLVDQNLILNTLFWEPYDENNSHNLLRYYAVNMENAKIFQEKLSSESADLSLKKFWNQNKFDYSVELKEIDFDKETPQYTVIDHDTGGLWGEVWPVL